jgi:hypothetical protein
MPLRFIIILNLNVELEQVLSILEKNAIKLQNIVNATQFPRWPKDVANWLSLIYETYVYTTCSHGKYLVNRGVFTSIHVGGLMFFFPFLLDLHVLFQFKLDNNFVAMKHNLKFYANVIFTFKPFFFPFYFLSHQNY